MERLYPGTLDPREYQVRIGLLAHDLTRPEMRGFRRYATGLAQALSKHPEIELVLFCRTSPACDCPEMRARWEIWPGCREVLWEQVDLPRRLARLEIDLLHAPSNSGLPLWSPGPMVLTRHDAIDYMFPPEFPGSRRSRVRKRYSDEISVRRASRVITVSERSRQDILRQWRLRPERVVNCGEGIDDKFFNPVAECERRRVRCKWVIDRPYILYVGGFDKRKDVGTLLSAFFLLNSSALRLVLCGSLRGEGANIERIVQQHPLGSLVRITGDLADEDIAPLYAGAQVFVYPSRYEGFGLQAIEAMAVGTPVVVSDGGSLPEVTGGAAVVFKAGDPDDCARAITATLDIDRSEIIALGQSRARHFRWATVIRDYVEIYRALVN